MILNQKSLISASDLAPEDVKNLFLLAQNFKLNNKTNLKNLLNSYSIALLFFEPSTRTQASFELSAKRQGADTIVLSGNHSSVQKGESLLDTLKTLEALNIDLFVLRHHQSGMPFFLSKKLQTPIINAGDGINEHPTQALIDAFTIESELGTVKDKKVLILGDILHSRVAKSNITLLTMLGAKVFISGPPPSIPKHFNSSNIEHISFPEDILPQVDAVMTLRVQKERHKQSLIPSHSDYHKHWGLTEKRAALLPSHSIILHPGPTNPGVEIDQAVAESKNSMILKQVQNGLFIRSAVLTALLAPKSFSLKELSR